MESILNQFNKNVISLMENYLKNLLFSKGIANFTEDLVSEFANFGSNLTQFIFEYAEEAIFNIECRINDFESYQKSNMLLQY